MKRMVRTSCCLAMVAGLGFVVRGDVVPDGCTELEYVESDGTQYVRSGYSDGAQAIVYELDADFAQNGRQGGTRFRLNYTDKTLGAGRHKLRLELATNGHLDIYVDGVLKGTDEKTDRYNGNGIFVFACGNGTTGLNQTAPYQTGKVYSFKLTINGILQRDLVPALDANNVACFYDKVYKSKLYSATETALIAGPVRQGLRVATIPRQFYDGEAVRPKLTVRALDGTALTEGVHYTCAYSDNASVGTGLATVTGIGDYSGKMATESFRIVAPYEDDNIFVKSDGVVMKDLRGRIAYIFSDTVGPADVTIKRDLTLEGRLVVGGGGAGGYGYAVAEADSADYKYLGAGGGGGGGGVIYSGEQKPVKAGTPVSVSVGAGGDNRIGSYAAGSYPGGGAGGNSVLTIGEVTETALGGGGGASYDTKTPTADGHGSGGGCVKSGFTPVDGTHYTTPQGHAGGTSSGAPSGGGGWALAGSAASTPRANQTSPGGAGFTCDITGESQVYGSGGGAGRHSTWAGESAGGVNAGNGVSNAARAANTNGRDGFGGGGGGGGREAPGPGGNGGAGTVVLLFSVGDNVGYSMTVDDIEACGYYYGEPVCLKPVVRDGETGEPLAEGTDYELLYADNDAVGTATVTVKGLGHYSGCLWVDKPYRIVAPRTDDEYIDADDGSFVRVQNGGRIVYIFTNIVWNANVKVKQLLTLEEYLVVGGGGAGGWGYQFETYKSGGAGGGGGGVIHSDRGELCVVGDTLTLTVGRGGDPRVGAYVAGEFPAGGRGDRSSLTLKGTTHTAYGGGGGASYDDPYPTADGLVGSGGGFNAYKGGSTDGVHYTSSQGHAGGDSVGSTDGAPGSGGGAGQAGVKADTNGRNYSVAGGQGLAVSITGAEEVYGSGGGAGHYSSYVWSNGGLGGTNAGQGGPVSSGNSRNARDGFGGGGGGGQRVLNGQSGGRGGSGTVILAFSVGDNTAHRMTVADLSGYSFYHGEPVCPRPVVRNSFTGEELSEGDDYELSYSGNEGPGEGRVTVTGVGDYACTIPVTKTFQIALPSEDERILSDDGAFVCKSDGERIVYVFTNVVGDAVVSLKQAMTLEEVLVVGGGGAGGWGYAHASEKRAAGGGGGGGGGFLHTNLVRALSAGSSFTVNVGRGGDPNEHYDYERNPHPAGGNGGASSFVLGDVALTAFGGGGGASYDSGVPGSGRLGSSGGFCQAPSADYRTVGEGVYYTAAQGNLGTISTNWKSGGGGGAGGAAAYLGSGNDDGTWGAEGRVCDITGECVVYGSGGGPGHYSTWGGCFNGAGGVGGTNAGQGKPVSSGSSANGKVGTGAGGGGSNRGNGDVGTAGGRGGSGTVVLVFRAGDTTVGPRLAASVVEKAQYTGGVTSPEPVVTDGEAALEKDRDYAVAYLNNVFGKKADGTDLNYVNGPAWSWAVVTGLGDYAGQVLRLPYQSMSAILVAADGDPESDGASWSTATTLGHALALVGTDEEIWVKAGTIPVAATLSSSKAFVLRGGYAGDDDANPGKLAANPVTVLDGQDARGTLLQLTLNNGAYANTVERFDFVRATGSAFVKGNAGQLVMRDCGFVDNRGTGAGVNGRGGSFSGGMVSLWNCRFVGNQLPEAAGNKAFAGGGAYFSGTVVSMDGCLFASNGIPLSAATWYTWYNDSGAAFYATASRVTARNCRFVGNRQPVSQGGTSNCGGTIRLVGNCGGSRFENCLFLGNEDSAQNTADFSASDPMNFGGALYVGMDASSRTLTIDKCTFAYNLTDGYNCSAGLTLDTCSATVRDSIFYGNVAHGKSLVGADLAVKAGAYADVDDTLFAAAAETEVGYLSSASAAQLALGAGVVYGNPQFVTSEASWLADLSDGAAVPRASGYAYIRPAASDSVYGYDVHLKSSGRYRDNAGVVHEGEAVATSQAILFDGRNLGFYAGTDEASALPPIVPALDGDVEVTWEGGYSQPRIGFTLADSGGVSYNARVTVVYSDGTHTSSNTVVGVASGKGVSFLGGKSLTPHADYWGEVIIEAGGKAVRSEFAGTVDAEYHPSWGHGCKGVIHVRAGATGDRDGSDWFNAFDDIRTALSAVTSERREVWVAGTLVSRQDGEAVRVNQPVVVRGGFAGVEDALAERPAEGCATLDGRHEHDLLSLANTQPVTIERLAFVNSSKTGLSKSDVGDLTLVGCRIEGNGWSLGSVNGYGMAVSGSAAATALVVSNTVFAGNGIAPYGTGYWFSANDMGTGFGAYVASLGDATFDGCLFVTNGVPFDQPEAGNTGWRTFGASALAAVNVPVTMRGCRFVGNRAFANGSGGSTVRLGEGTGGSRLANCLFVGNQHNALGKGDAIAGGGGEICIAAGDAADAYEIVNCTFALNLTDVSTLSAAGVNVRTGAANVRNCVFESNLVGSRLTTGATDLAVGASGTANVSYSLFNSSNGLYAAAGGTLVKGAGLVYDRANLVTTFATYRHATYTSAGGGAYLAPDLLPTLLKANCHLRGKAGYVDETTGLRVKDWKHPASRAVDGGDPVDSFAREPKGADFGNGKRINMGFYGNTPYATGTKTSGFAIVIDGALLPVPPKQPGKYREKKPEDYDDIIVCDQNGQYARIYDGRAAMSGTWTEIWSFKMPGGNIAECKPFRNGTLVGLVDNSGNWRIVDRTTSEVVASGKADGSSHSLEILPGDIVATASTDGSHAFQFFDWAGKSIAKFTGFSYPHGLYWDDVGERLYLASSDGLMRARVGYDEGGSYAMTIERTWATEDLGLTDAHDLRVVPGTRLLVISTLQKVVFFDMERGEWAEDRFVFRYNTKAADPSEDGRSYLLTVPNGVNQSWQTDTLELLEDGVFKTLPRIPSAWIYKARWFPRQP